MPLVRGSRYASSQLGLPKRRCCPHATAPSLPALHGVLSATQYGHLRLLSTLLLGPLLGVRYLVYLGWRTPHTP